MTFAMHISRIMSSQWFARGVSLVIAFVLWQYVEFQGQRTEQMLLPLEFRNQPAALYTESTHLSGKVVIGEISGKAEDVRELYSIVRTARCYVDLSDAQAGRHKYKIHMEKNASIRWALEKVDFSLKKQFFEIPFQEKIEKELPIQFQIDKDLQKRFKSIGTISYTPHSTKVYGPEDYINDLEYIQSKQFNFRNKYSDFETKLGLLYPNKHIYSLSPNYITVSVDFKSSIRDMRFADVRVIVVNNLQNIEVHSGDNLQLQYIVYRGPEDLIKKINKNTLVAYVDLSRYTRPGRYSVFVYPQEFEHLEVIEYAPKHLKIGLREKQ